VGVARASADKLRDSQAQVQSGGLCVAGAQVSSRAHVRVAREVEEVEQRL